jgi:hypothetical protein
VLAKDGSDAAIALIEKSWIGMKRPVFGAQLREFASKVTNEYGTYLGHEYIGEAKLGSTYRRLTYLMNYRYYGVQAQIVFYKAGDVWNVVGINFWDNLNQLEFK